MRVLVITLGATALQKFDEASGMMQLGLAPHELLAQAAVEGCDTELHQLPVRRFVCMCAGQGAVVGWDRNLLLTALLAVPLRSGAELTLTSVTRIRDTILSSLAGGTFGAFVLLIGTDTLEEAAFLLHLMLAAALRQAGRALVITGRLQALACSRPGFPPSLPRHSLCVPLACLLSPPCPSCRAAGAMLPADQLGSDNAKNLRDAIKARGGCLICRCTHKPCLGLCGGCHTRHLLLKLAYTWSSPHLPIQCMLRMQVASSAVTQQLKGGAFVVMNDDIHLAQYVRK